MSADFMAEKEQLEKESTTNTALKASQTKSQDETSFNNVKHPERFGTLQEESYEPWRHRNVQHPLSNTGALAHMIKGSLGSGILSMPVAFKHGGLWTSLVGAIFIGFLYAHCVSIVVYSSQVLCVRLKRPRMKFAEIAEAAFQSGPVKLQRYTALAKVVVDVSLFIGWYSTCMVYVVFIASSLQQVLEYDFGIEMNIRWYILFATVFLLPIGLIRNLRYLVPFSTLAICALSVSCGYVFYEIFQGLPPVFSRPAFKSFQTLPMFLTTVLFAFDGIGMVFPIENNMKNPRRFLGCPGVLNIAILWLMSMYAGMGFFGYLRYGEATKGTITLNISTSSVMGRAVKIMVTLNVLCSYTLFLYVPVEILWRVLESKFEERRKSFYHYLLRVVLVLGTVMVAVLVPDLEPFVGLVGGIGSTTLILFFPPLIELVTFWKDKDYMGPLRWRLYKNLLILLLWLLILVTGTQASLVEIVALYR